MKQLLLYGATGYTGGLILEQALAFGMKPILAGRSRQRLTELGRREGLETRCAELVDPRALEVLLQGVDVVLNAAGPFHATAEPLARAAVGCGAHYLDISGELKSMTALASLDDAARRTGSMLMSGVGFDVVPTDCLARYVATQLPTADRLEIALSGLNAISRGSVLSLFEQYGDLVTVRRQGKLVRVAPGTLTAHFDFGAGRRAASAISWGDVVSAYATTGIENITVYYEATPLVQAGLRLSAVWGWWLSAAVARPFVRAGAELFPPGPDAAYRARASASIVARAIDPAGRYAEARATTPEVYSFTAMASVAIADRVLHGQVLPGCRTPASVYGHELLTALPGVEVTAR